MTEGSSPGIPGFVTPAPEAGLILAAFQNQSREFARGFRPRGTRDWLLVSTLTGLGYVRVGAVSQTLNPGDLLLIAPDTPQEYGYLHQDGDWTNIWVHFQPRPHWMSWLVWPQLARGVMILSAADRFAPISSALRQMVEAATLPIRLGPDLALNSLERALILSDEVNPLHETLPMDRRIRAALELIGEDLARPLRIDRLSRAVGLSRSRFSTLFVQATAMSAQAYVEQARLARAAQMLQVSNWSVGLIAAEVGFPDPYYFSTRFRRRYGLSPRAHRDRVQNLKS